MERNFALDAFRALAIMLVFLAHTVKSAGAPDYLAPLQLGGTGVDLFFVLSGWLIGNQLFLEKERYGNIEIRRFWFRRWMRTMPAYYAVLFVTLAHQYFTKADFSFPWAHLFFVQNYQENLQLFYVSWSLSVEEQFYLLIAPLVVGIFKLPRLGQLSVLMLLLLSPSIFRYFDLYSSLNETHVRLDCCAMGVMLAYIKHHFANIWAFLKTHTTWLFPIAVLLYLFFYLARYNPHWGVADPSKLSLAIMFGVWILWTDKTSFTATSLWHKLTVHISTRSYAMYLLHVDALIITKKLFSDLPFLPFFMLALLLTLALSEVLYRVIEMPIMNARKYFSFSKSRGQINKEQQTSKGTVNA